MSGKLKLDINFGAIMKAILLVLVIILLASIMGIDGCTCGCGPEVRESIRSIVNPNHKGKRK